tara:strand:- start:454 stop:837 length:384 start_codon:yes stop_codon:yes gene_type:complete
MSLIQMNAEQMRRQAMKNQEDKLAEQKNYQTKIDSMSKSNVGGLYDIRSIMKSQTEQKLQNHYSVQQAESELEDLLQVNRLYTSKISTYEYIKKVSGREPDSFNIRETGKFISELINKIKEKYEVKE